MTSWRGLTPRSWERVELATVHPSPGAPISWSSGTNTSSRNTSLNSASPVICTSGRTSTPAACMSTTRQEMPCCRLGASGSAAGQAQTPVGELGVGGPDLAAGDQPPALDPLGPGGERGQVAAGVGLGEQLAPQVVGRRGWEAASAGCCSSVPWANRVGPTRLMPIRPTSSGARARASSSVTTKCSVGSETPPAELDRPGDPDPPVGGQPGLPPTDRRPPPRRGRRSGAASPTPYSHGRLATSHSWSSARSSCCSGVIRRSMAVSLAQRSRRHPAARVARVRWPRAPP